MTDPRDRSEDGGEGTIVTDPPVSEGTVGLGQAADAGDGSSGSEAPAAVDDGPTHSEAAEVEDVSIVAVGESPAEVEDGLTAAETTAAVDDGSSAADEPAAVDDGSSAADEPAAVDDGSSAADEPAAVDDESSAADGPAAVEDGRPPEEAPADAADDPGAAAEAPADPTASAALQPELVSPVEEQPAEAAPAAPVPTVSFTFNLAKIPDQGEDADPILRTGPEVAVLAVFDGMGGAGGTVYQTSDGPRTGAYMASRIARDTVEARMLTLLDPDWHFDGPSAAADLRRSVQAALVQRLAELNPAPSALRSKLLRALPTTMALAALQRERLAPDSWLCHLLWAGDSRVYLLDPVTGAHQLTVDDIRDRGDALQNLRDDSVISNAMSADIPFAVNHHQIRCSTPVLVVAATDGCFGYLPTPMHFEHLVLSTLSASSDAEDWSARLQAEITSVTGDDAAMAVLGLGADHAGLQSVFGERNAGLAEVCIAPLDTLSADIARLEAELDDRRQQLREHTEAQWAEYKSEYERHLGAPSSKGSP